MPKTVAFGEWSSAGLAAMLEEAGASVTQLAAGCGVTENTARSWRDGGYAPRLDQFPAVVRFFMRELEQEAQWVIGRLFPGD